METWNAAQCAAYWGDKPGGITESWWRGLVSQGKAPKPLGYDPATGRKVWDAEEVRAAMSNRPGQGRRTDLDTTKGLNED